MKGEQVVGELQGFVVNKVSGGQYAICPLPSRQRIGAYEESLMSLVLVTRMGFTDYPVGSGRSLGVQGSKYIPIYCLVLRH